MIDALIRWSLNHRFLVLALAVGLLIWGGLRVTKMPVDVFPDLSSPTVTVVVEAHGMAPVEVERLLTFPIESSLNGASHVRRVRSSSTVGVAVLWVEFEWGTDIYNARQIVSEKLQLVRASLPPDVAPPVLAPISSIMGEVLFIGLNAKSEGQGRALRTFADWELRRRLLAVPGVAQVIPIGGFVQQFQVVIKPEAMARYGLGVDEVIDAVAQTNENVSAGFLERGGQEFLLYGVGRVERLAQLEQAVIKAQEGAIIRIQDVAEVVIGDSIRRGAASINAQEGVILGIQKQPGVNSLALDTRLNEALTQIEATMPEGFVLHRRLLRQADFIEASVNNISDALRDGAVLVILIIGLFLVSMRATLITALAIPLSLLTAALCLELMGISLNTMTLGGMAIAVGALVDDAIIDVENVIRRLRLARGQRLSAAQTVALIFEASKEIRGSIVFATLIIVLVFLPLFFLHGVEGLLLQPLGFAYVISLLASLVVALTITPALCLWLLPNSRAVRVEHEPWLTERLSALYERALKRSVSAWPLWLTISGVGVIVAIAGGFKAGRAFLPEFNEGALTISVGALAGTSLAQSEQLGQRVEQALLAHPEVVSTARRTGRAELDEHAQGVNYSELEVKLKEGVKDKGALLARLRQDLSAIQGVNITIGQPITHRIDHMISGTRANIAVKIFGPDLHELTQQGQRAKALMADLPGVVDLSVEQQAYLPMMTIRLDRAAMARYGLRVHTVTQAMEVAFGAHAVTRIISDSAAFDLVVRYPQAARQDEPTIRGLMLRGPTGALIPLEAVAHLARDMGPNQISRESGQRKVVVMCNVGEGHDLGGVVTRIQAKLKQLQLKPGYYVEYGGQFEAAQQAAETLFLLSLVVLLGVGLLLFNALKDARDATLVMLNLPLALIGGVAGVYLAGGVISIASIIGFITLFGIATRNGIMVVTHIKQLITHEGVTDPTQAVIQGAKERLAPILMTALATGLGLLPLATAGGESGSEIQAPMAIVILAGLSSATLLNMFVVPSLMLRFGSVRRATREG